MRGFVLGILFLAKPQDSGTSLMFTGFQHYIWATQRDRSGFISIFNADRAERRKRRQEIIDREISEKIKKLNELGETVESILSEVEHTCTTQEAEESDQLQDGSIEDEQMGKLETKMDVAGEKLVEDTDKKRILVDNDSGNS